MKWRTAAITVLVTTPACAHEGHAYPGSIWDTLTLDPAITVPLIVSSTLYAVGIRRLWLRAGIGHGVTRWHVAAFATGWLTLAIALVSPIHWLGEQLFSVHLVEHELLMAVAAPLLVLSRPTAAFLWALPSEWRKGLRTATHGHLWSRAWEWLTRPIVATIVHGIGIWIWHVPVLFDAAVHNEAKHLLQHVSFLGTALLFWWALVRQPVRHYGGAALHVYVTMVHTALLGAILVFAQRVLYVTDPTHTLAWGFTPLEDQQLAGLVMWIPAGTIYAGAGVAFLAQWIRRKTYGSTADVQPKTAPAVL